MRNKRQAIKTGKRLTHGSSVGDSRNVIRFRRDGSIKSKTHKEVSSTSNNFDGSATIKVEKTKFSKSGNKKTKKKIKHRIGPAQALISAAGGLVVASNNNKKLNTKVNKVLGGHPVKKIFKL